MIAPKLLACILVVKESRTRRQFGGGFRILWGFLIETLLSGLIAPVMMIFQSMAVGEILLGTRCGLAGAAPGQRWTAPIRIDTPIYSLPTIFGIAMAAIAYAISLPLLFWMTPVIAGLLLCIPIAMLSSAVFPNPDY